MTSTTVPSSAPMEEDDLTPTASPSVAPPLAQQVEATILSSIPERNLASSMHAPGNEMVDNSFEPTVAPLPPPDLRAIPNLSDEVTSHILEVMFTALRQNLAPIIASVERLSNIVDGRTPLRHATSATPPSATTLPYPKQTSGRADSGGCNGSPQGEENDSGRPSSGVPWNPNPISTQEVSGETCAAEDTLGKPKLGRKAQRTQAVKAANVVIPGVAPPPTDRHIALQHACISPMFVQIATANAMKQHDKAQGFRVAASSAQNRKASGVPRRGQAITPQGVTEVTIIRYGGISDVAKEGALCTRHPVTFVEHAQQALNQLSCHPPVILKGRWSTMSATTGNFVFTLSRTYSPEFIHNIRESLCEPFPGKCVVVPTEGWTWAQLRQVPIQDDDGLIYSCDDLYNALITNPCFQSVLLTVQPSWIGKPENAKTETAAVSFAYIEKDKVITQHATLEGVCMFGCQIQFVHCGDKAILMQCSKCHAMDHFAWRCPLPAGQVRCARCGGNHPMDAHDYECPGNHQGKAKCNCVFPCLLCGQKGHHAHSRSCPKCAHIVKLFDSSPPPPKRTKATPAPACDRTPNAEARQAHAAAVKAPLCKVDPSLNVFQCGLLNKEKHKECQIPVKDAHLPFNSSLPLMEGVAVGIAHAKRMV